MVRGGRLARPLRPRTPFITPAIPIFGGGWSSLSVRVVLPPNPMEGSGLLLHDPMTSLFFLFWRLQEGDAASASRC